MTSMCKFTLAIILLIVLIPSGPISAATITLTDTERGSYDSTGFFGTSGSGTAIGNYLTGVLSSVEYRSFFNFDLSGISGTVTSAELRISTNTTNGTGQGSATPDNPETLGIFDVTTSIPNLVTDLGGVAAFNDLGGGIQYASVFVPTPTSNGTIIITLNAAALSDINTAIGGDFAVGGVLPLLIRIA